MKFSAILALAAGVSANSLVSYVTETVTAVTTFCPAPTEVTYGDITYTVTEATTLTITDCNPCTIHRPITTISSVVCSTSCPSPSPKPPHYNNSTIPALPPAPPATTKTPIGTISPPSPTDSLPPIETAGAGRTVALSGGALAGVLGIAAFVL
ncbi:hypothetical protein VTK26DRAFT_3694 [Humicola hyalothermophila]